MEEILNTKRCDRCRVGGCPEGLAIRRPLRGSRRARPRLNIPRSSICRILQSSNEIRVPPARRFAGPLGFHSLPVGFQSTFCLNPMYFTIDRASEVLKIRILNTSGPRSSKHYANYFLRELRIQNLDTSGTRSSLHYANHALWELGMGILDTPGQSFSVFSAGNRPTRLNSSGSIHKMMTSRVRR